MNKLLQYFKSGNGRGLKLVFWAALLWSLAFGGLTYYVGQRFFQNQIITSFVDSVPSFVIKNGVIQNNTLVWQSALPLTRVPVTIDTTKENLSLPVPDGMYVTRNAVFLVSNRGTQIGKQPLKGDYAINPTTIKKTLNMAVIVSAVIVFLVFILTSWLGYLVSVALTALLGWLFKATLSPKRAWRVAAVTWVCGFVLIMALALFGIAIGSTWLLVLVTTLLNVIILKRLKD